MWTRIGLLLLVSLVALVVGQPVQFGGFGRLTTRLPVGRVGFVDERGMTDVTAGRTLGRRRRPINTGMQPADVDVDIVTEGDQDDVESRFILQPAQLLRFIVGWPAQSRLAVLQTRRKYGAPTHITTHFIKWDNVGDFKKIIVYRYGVRHNHPVPHLDIIEHVVNYRVPPQLFDDLARFHSSIVAKRTDGELSVKCYNERINTMVLNLAHDVVTGEKTWREAREEYEELWLAERDGQFTEEGDGLLFDPVSTFAARDPDVIAVQD